MLAAPDRDTAQWSADSLGRSEIEEVSEGFSYGANTIRDGVSLTPRRELRALALPSEIMRLANLEGYLKFPGPFPVASISLNYVARPNAAERFVPREADGGDVGASKVAPDDEGMPIPDVAEGNKTGGGSLPERADAPETALVQGELDLPPLPGETGSAEAPEDDVPEDDVPDDDVPDDEPLDNAPPEPEAIPPNAPAIGSAAEDEDAATPDAGRSTDWY